MSTEVLGGLAGLALFIFGMRMLVLGRAPGMIARSFRSPRDAGCYHVLFGFALLIYVGGLHLPGTVAGQVAAVVAMFLVAIALVRFRPRGRGPTRKA